MKNSHLVWLVVICLAVASYFVYTYYTQTRPCPSDDPLGLFVECQRPANPL